VDVMVELLSSYSQEWVGDASCVQVGGRLI